MQRVTAWNGRNRREQEGRDDILFLLVVRIAQAERELQLVVEVVIAFPEHGIGIERVGRQRAEVVAARAVDGAAEDRHTAGAGINRNLPAEERAASGVVDLGQSGQRVRQNRIAIGRHLRVDRLEVHLDGAKVEVERAIIGRLQANLVRRLFAATTGDVEGAEPVRSAELRIVDHAAREQEAVENRNSGEGASRRVEADRRSDLVVVFQRLQRGFAVAADIAELQGVGDVILALESVERLVREIGRVESRLDIAQVWINRRGERVAVEQAGRDRETAAERGSRVDAVAHVFEAICPAAEGGDQLVNRANGNAVEGRLERVLGAELLARAKAVIFFFEVLGNERGAEIVRRFEQDRAADAIQFAAVDRLAGDGVVGKPVALKIAASHANGEHVADRHVQHAFVLGRVVVAEGDGGAALILFQDRLRGDGVEHAAGGVTAVERTLRAAQNLDALHVEELGFEEAVGAQRHVVLVDTHARVARLGDGVDADTADAEVEAAEVAGREGGVRDGFQEVRAAGQLHLVEGSLVKGRNGDRNVLDGLFDFLGGDGDRAKAAVIFRCGVFLGDCQGAEQAHRQGRSTCQQDVFRVCDSGHSNFPPLGPHFARHRFCC